MKLEQSFEVAAPIDRVWDALIDVEKVAPCLPGASVTGRNEDGSYAGNLTIKIGPTTAAYAGRLQMEDVDKGAHTATMQAQGTDKRGQGGAKATITSKLSETANGTHVDVSTDYHITGRLARFGRGGMIEDISNRLLREFASSLQSSLVDQPAAPAPAPTPAARAGGGRRLRAGGGGAGGGGVGGRARRIERCDGGVGCGQFPAGRAGCGPLHGGRAGCGQSRPPRPSRSRPASRACRFPAPRRTRATRSRASPS